MAFAGVLPVFFILSWNKSNANKKDNLVYFYITEHFYRAIECSCDHEEDCTIHKRTARKSTELTYFDPLICFKLTVSLCYFHFYPVLFAFLFRNRGTGSSREASSENKVCSRNKSPWSPRLNFRWFFYLKKYWMLALFRAALCFWARNRLRLFDITQSNVQSLHNQKFLVY